VLVHAVPSTAVELGEPDFLSRSGHVLCETTGTTMAHKSTYLTGWMHRTADMDITKLLNDDGILV